MLGECCTNLFEHQWLKMWQMWEWTSCRAVQVYQELHSQACDCPLDPENAAYVIMSSHPTIRWQGDNGEHFQLTGRNNNCSRALRASPTVPNADMGDSTWLFKTGILALSLVKATKRCTSVATCKVRIIAARRYCVRCDTGACSCWCVTLPDCPHDRLPCRLHDCPNSQSQAPVSQSTSRPLALAMLFHVALPLLPCSCPQLSSALFLPPDMPQTWLFLFSCPFPSPR